MQPPLVPSTSIRGRKWMIFLVLLVHKTNWNDTRYNYIASANWAVISMSIIPQQTQSMLFYRWSTVYDAGPTLKQHWFNVCWLSLNEERLQCADKVVMDSKRLCFINCNAQLRRILRISLLIQTAMRRHHNLCLNATSRNERVVCAPNVSGT